MIRKLWLRLWALPFLLTLMAVGQLVPSATFAYDEQHRARPPCAVRSETNYDYASVLFGNERKTWASADCALFGHVPEFLAADSGGTRLLAPYTGYQSWAGDIRSVTAASDTTMYRVWGGGSQQVGPWLSPVAPTSAAAATESLALPAANTAQFYSEVLVPAGTRYQIGTAAAANGLGGGGVQVQLLERIPVGNFGPGIPLH